MLAAVKAYCARNPHRCLRMLHVPFSDIDACDLARTQVPAAIDAAEDDMSVEPITLSCMRGVPVDHVIREFLVPVLAVVDPGRAWHNADWLAFFAHSVAPRLAFSPVPSALRAAEALIDAIGTVGDADSAAHFGPTALRRARDFTGADVALLHDFDSSAVLARIMVIPLVDSPGAIVFDEFRSLPWPTVVEGILVPVLATEYDERVATRALVTRMLASGTNYLIRAAWLDALDDADVASYCAELAPYTPIVPLRLLPALACARAGAVDGPVAPRVRRALVALAERTIDVGAPTVDALLATFPSALLDAACAAANTDLAVRAAWRVANLRAELAHVALLACARFPDTPLAARLSALVHATVRGVLDSSDELELVCSSVLRNGAVAAMFAVLDAPTFTDMCDAMAEHDQHARVALFLAHAESAAASVRVTLQETIYACLG